MGYFFQETNSLKVSLHKLEKKLDSGKIYKQKKLNLNKIKNIYQLRHYNTEICIDLTIKLLNDLKKKIQLKKSFGRIFFFHAKNL